VKDRRRFLLTSVAGVLGAPLAVGAQRARKMFRVGALATGSPEALRQGLRDAGYVEGLNLVIEWRDAEGNTERLGDLAADLVRLKVDVIVAATRRLPLPPRRRQRRSRSSW
jgi:putative tryptophan/tyrosine transport system substrate-binding protein